MKLYFIRHKPTGHYLPEPVGRMGRGGSHTEPDPDTDKARVFRTKRAANNALIAWLRGKFVAHRGIHSGGPDFYEEYYEDLELIAVPSRKRDEMEIVEKEIVL